MKFPRHSSLGSESKTKTCLFCTSQLSYFAFTLPQLKIISTLKQGHIFLFPRDLLVSVLNLSNSDWPFLILMDS